jgi:hypothetical protein
MSGTGIWRLQQATLALRAGRQRLIEADPDMALEIAEDLPEEAKAVEDAIVRVCRAAIEAEDLERAAKERAAATAARAKRFGARADELRGVAFAALDALGKTRLVAGDLTVSLRAGRQTAVVTDEEKIPDEYFDVEFIRKLNKKRLNEDVEAGVVVEGAVLGNARPVLTIKGS